MLNSTFELASALERPELTQIMMMSSRQNRSSTLLYNLSVGQSELSEVHGELKIMFVCFLREPI